MDEKELKNYFESIDFLPLGKKIAKLGEAIGIARKVGKRKRVEIPEELKFLFGLDLRELNKVIALLHTKHEEEIRKFREMQAVFGEYNAKISDEQIKSISYPDEVITHEYGMDLYCFRSKRMKKWYKDNV